MSTLPESSPASESLLRSESGEGKLPLILGLLNAVLVLATVGLMSYTKLVFKRPRITEQTERARLAAIAAKPKPPTKPGLVTFEPITVNIEAADGNKAAIAENPDAIPFHYASVGFSLEIRDETRQQQIEDLRPLLLDQVISMMGHKGYQVLTTVQGRYVVRAQIIEIANQLIEQRFKKRPKDAPATPVPPTEGLVTNVFFTQFVVQ